MKVDNYSSNLYLNFSGVNVELSGPSLPMPAGQTGSSGSVANVVPKSV